MTAGRDVLPPEFFKKAYLKKHSFLETKLFVSFEPAHYMLNDLADQVEEFRERSGAAEADKPSASPTVGHGATD